MASDGRQRWWTRWRRGRTAPELDPGRPDLVVVAAGFDDAEASSVTLERAASTEPRWQPDAPAVLRHHLVLPDGSAAEAVAVAGQDGYREGPSPDRLPPEVRSDIRPGERLLVLQRVQVLDALHCSQERSRMAGLAQRRDGRVLGWDALQPGSPPAR
jgi:hypothetical protein